MPGSSEKGEARRIWYRFPFGYHTSERMLMLCERGSAGVRIARASAGQDTYELLAVGSCQ